MSENIIMPKLGMTMKEGTVEEWFKSEGDTVEEGESIVTISSEKLTNDVEAPTSGTLLKIKVQAGEDAKVKAVLGIIGEEGEDLGSDDDDSEETTKRIKITTQLLKINKLLQMKNNLIKRYRKEAKPEQRERIFISH